LRGRGLAPGLVQRQGVRRGGAGTGLGAPGRVRGGPLRAAAPAPAADSSLNQAAVLEALGAPEEPGDAAGVPTLGALAGGGGEAEARAGAGRGVGVQVEGKVLRVELPSDKDAEVAAACYANWLPLGQGSRLVGPAVVTSPRLRRPRDMQGMGMGVPASAELPWVDS